MDEKNEYSNNEIINDNEEMTEEEFSKLTDDEKIDIVAKRILKKYRHAFEMLA